MCDASMVGVGAWRGTACHQDIGERRARVRSATQGTPARTCVRLESSVSGPWANGVGKLGAYRRDAREGRSAASGHAVPKCAHRQRDALSWSEEEAPTMGLAWRARLRWQHAATGHRAIDTEGPKRRTREGG
jgi:hypothetical protein